MNKKTKKFKNWSEMYKYLHDEGDLYSKSLGTYAFLYNEAGAICIYTLSPDDVSDLLKDSQETGEYWSAFLGWKGSEILDNDSEYEKYRYSEKFEEWSLYAEPTIQFCKETFNTTDWLDTNDVTEQYLQNN